MHGLMNVKFINAQQAKQTYNIKTRNKNCIRQTRQYSVAEHAECSIPTSLAGSQHNQYDKYQLL